MDDSPIDLSSLDPSREPERWKQLIDEVVEQARAAHCRRMSVAHQLVAWTVPALAIAAAFALVVWAGALSVAQRTATAHNSAADPAFVLARWAMTDERPATSAIWQVFGERYDRD